MFYPKCFEKQAFVVGEIADKAIKPLFTGVRRVFRAKDIVNHTAPVAASASTIPAPAVIPTAFSTDQDAKVYPHPFVDEHGRVYPAILGYQVPPAFIPRKIKPLLRNISDVELP